MLTISNYIGGEFCPASDQAYLESINPATGELLARLPNSSPEDVEKAVEQAELAFPSWAALPAEERAAFLAKIAEAINRRSKELAEAECQDSGKPLDLAQRVEIPRAARNMLFFSQAITQFASEAYPMAQGGLSYTLHEPLGVVACISPWNLPLYLLSWKVAPALASGNCVIAKPSELTPLTAYLLAEICREVGLPAGVLQILHGEGKGVGAALCQHPQVKAISFTGGTASGREIARQVAPQFKKISLEMGGKNPALIFADCDFDKTVAEMVRASFTNQGQVCLCSSRILVEDKLYKQFCEAFIEKIKALRLGDPLEPTTQVGALISRQHLEKIAAYVELAKQEGGRLLCGGKAAKIGGRCANGFFWEPTVFAELDNTCRSNQEEIFGPLVSIQMFHDEQQAIKLANQSPYGLSATIWSQDINRCHRLAAKLQAGIIWINSWLVRDLRTPFGGYKQSGLGREGGLEALRFFTQSKNVCFTVAPYTKS